MQNQRYNRKGTTQANEILKSSKSTVIAQLEQITATISAIKRQLKTLSLEEKRKKSTTVGSVGAASPMEQIINKQ